MENKPRKLEKQEQEIQKSDGTASMAEQLALEKAKVEKLIGLMMFTDPALERLKAGVVQDMQMHEYRKAFK